MERAPQAREGGRLAKKKKSQTEKSRKKTASNNISTPIGPC
jgi:hypothetical protein